MQKDYILKDGVLYHHGIKGQKWGERRFQNEDGSLTPEGRERYGYGEVVKRVGKKVGKYVVSSVKKRINKALEDHAIDAKIAADKARRRQDPLYDQKRKREEEREQWRRNNDPIYKLKKESEEAFKSEQEIEREKYKKREEEKKAQLEKYKKIGKAALTGALAGFAAAKIYQAGSVNQAFKDAIAVGQNVSKAISIKELKNMGIEVFEYEKFKY